ncbi:translation elongation factor EF1B gamma Ecym_2548 [Eremothecium cymbalariae DBVPG|uniref:GST C-terminal domain-containing protein n=1 Tax=Eremothecium cymbalariae (strain CBS 270.75 / DBVPG 7215 / KCTC 17166 / NRRL Y-17582) TaxID=931890 RepID=G8JQB0_ERECY|nr:Hypothetical protein Ecym_2548 [Eremothecium cymbalariae DBVPG\
MSQGTLISNNRIRCWVPRALVEYLNLDVKVLVAEENQDIWASNFPLKKVPCFLGPGGEFKLSEVIAVMVYLINLSSNQEKKDALLGTTPEEQAKVLMFLSLGNAELAAGFPTILAQVRGEKPFSKVEMEAALRYQDKIAAIYEQRLKDHTYLATDQLSLADLFNASLFTRGFEHYFDAEWRAAHPSIMKWFNHVTASPAIAALYHDFKPCEKFAAEPPSQR